MCLDSSGAIVQFNEAREILYQAATKAKLNKAVISQYGVYMASNNKLLFQAFTKKPKEKLIHRCESTITLLMRLTGIYCSASKPSYTSLIYTHLAKLKLPPMEKK
jgi:hypothetical protein